jgi:hypothetical protein
VGDPDRADVKTAVLTVGEEARALFPAYQVLLTIAARLRAEQASVPPSPAVSADQQPAPVHAPRSTARASGHLLDNQPIGK